jgi:hypothetical protein
MARQHEDVEMTTLEGCFTTVEHRMIAEGAFLKVRETRTMFQDWMRPRFVEIVERATGRKVRAFFSQVAHDPNIALELFLLEPAEPSTDVLRPRRLARLGRTSHARPCDRERDRRPAVRGVPAHLHELRLHQAPVRPRARRPTRPVPERA